MDSGTFHQRGKSRIFRSLQHFQPLFYKNPVFVGQIHNVSYRRDGYIFHQIIHIFRISSHGIVKCLDQLVGHSCSTQSFERVQAVLSFDIHHRVGRRNQVAACTVFVFFIRHFMMVCYNDSHSHTFPIRDLFARCDSVVTCHNCINIVIQRTVNQINI